MLSNSPHRRDPSIKEIAKAWPDLCCDRNLPDDLGYGRVLPCDECTLDSEGMISRLALREHIEKWSDEGGIRHPISARKFSAALKSFDIRNGIKYHGERFRSGIRWKTEKGMELSEQNRGF